MPSTRLLERMSPAMPATVARSCSGPFGSPVTTDSRIGCPIADLPGHNCRASVSLTTATSGLDAVSLGSKSRPATMGMPSVAK